ncbi:MAG: hypothetical protein PHR21_02170 [Oscillospiraceae bacterium]|nr:hypothetical protein [Oscillospiraceae bacterium]MDD4367451.1 hypothetical protein [Oscillospiraceae bacterium]
MSFIFILESLKFYKMKSERVVQLLFLLTLGINLLFSFYNPGDSDFSALQSYLLRELVPATTVVTTNFPTPVSTGNLIFLGWRLLQFALNLLLSFFYASAYTAERQGLPAVKGLKAMAVVLPQVLGLGLLLIVPALLSVFLLWIPLIILTLMLFMTPLILADQRVTLRQAMQTSADLSHKRKGFFFGLFFLLFLLASMAESLLLSFSESLTLVYLVVYAFLATLYVLMRGRLIGLIYYFFSRHPQISRFYLYTRDRQKELFEDITGSPPHSPDT